MSHEFNLEKDKIFIREVLSLRKEIDVPWRREQNPLKVLIGELLLIRTKVKQAVRVYHKFFEAFPNGKVPEGQKLFALEILKEAGLTHRAKGIIKVLDKLGGEMIVPDDPTFLKKLPYVSDYVISALRYFAYGYDVPLIDSNVIRLLNRYFGRTDGDGRHPTEFHKRKMECLINSAGSKKRDFILKTLDFAILICAPKPRCEQCPLVCACEYESSQISLKGDKGATK